MRIAFVVQNQYCFFNVYLDDVSISAGSAMQTVTVAANQAVTGVNFGTELVPSTSQIQGTAWNDANGNGVKDTGEAGLANRTVYIDSSGNGQYDAGEPYQTTDANGTYTFSGLAAGTYSVGLVPQNEWTQTYPAAASSQRLFAVRCSGTTGTIDELNPTTGAVINSFAAPAPLSGSGPQGLALGPTSLFYIDKGSSGPHTLWQLNPNTGAVIDSHVVDASAPVLIDGAGYLNGKVYLQAYDQILVWDPVADQLDTTLTVSASIIGGLTGAGDLGLLFAGGATGTIYGINPSTGAIVRTLTPAIPGTYGLAYVNDELVAANTSSSATAYLINPTTGAVLTSFALGGSGVVSALGGDGAVAATTVQTVTVAANQTVSGVNFGAELTGSAAQIQGTVWNDANGNGVKDTGEAGLANRTVYIDSSGNGQYDAGEPSQTTDANGTYTFTGLAAGTYSVGLVPQTGWTQTSPAAGQVTVANGGFESGTLSGWTPEDTGPVSWDIDNGTYHPASGAAVVAPYDGAYSAICDTSGPSTNAIYQTVTLPASPPAILHWVDQIDNFHTAFVNPTQQFRVEVRNSSDQVLATLFSTNPGDPLTQGWTQRSASLSAYAGQTVRIAFVVQNQYYYFNVYLDNVSISAGSAMQTVAVPAHQTVSGVNFGAELTRNSTITALGVSAASTIYGQAETLTATVSAGSGSATGTVTFMNGTSALGTPLPLTNATAALTVTSLPAGTDAVTAVYNGDANNQGSTSAASSIQVAQAMLTVTANSTSKTYGQTLSFAGTEFATSGLVNSDSVTSVTLASAGAAASAAVGTYTIVPSAAVGSGLNNYAITYANGTLTITPEIITVTSTQTMDSLATSGNVQAVVEPGGQLTVGSPVDFETGGSVSVLSGGELTVPGLNLGSSPATLYLDGGTLQAGSSFQTSVPLTIEAGGGTVDTQGFDVTLGAAIGPGSGSGGLCKIGPGRLTLAVGNSYSGGTSISAGTLVVATGDALPPGGGLTIDDTGGVVLDSFSIPASGMGYGRSGGGPVAAAAAVPAFSDQRSAVSYGGGPVAAAVPAFGDQRSAVSYGSGPVAAAASVPAFSDQRSAVSYGSGPVAATAAAVPAISDQRSAVSYGSGPVAASAASVPAVSDQRSAVSYGSGPVAAAAALLQPTPAAPLGLPPLTTDNRQPTTALLTTDNRQPTTAPLTTDNRQPRTAPLTTDNRQPRTAPLTTDNRQPTTAGPAAAGPAARAVDALLRSSPAGPLAADIRWLGDLAASDRSRRDTAGPATAADGLGRWLARM